MERKEFCVYNETRENFLSSRVTVIDTKADPLKVVKALIEGPGGGSGIGSAGANGTGAGAHRDSALWLNPLKTVPSVSTLSPYDLVYLDQDCRVLHSVAVIPDSEVPQFTGQASSALLLPSHTFTETQTHPGDQFVICAFEEIERRSAHVSASSTLAPVSLVAAPASAATLSTGTGILSSPPPSALQRPKSTTWRFEPDNGHECDQRGGEIQQNVEAEGEIGAAAKSASKIGFLRGIVHLRVHISISMAPLSDRASAAVSGARAGSSSGARWSGNLSLPARAHWLGRCATRFAQQRGSIKSHIVQPVQAAFRRRFRPALAAFARWVARTTRAEAGRATGHARSLKRSYLRWADRLIFGSAQTSNASTGVMHAFKHRPPFDHQRRSLLKARFQR